MATLKYSRQREAIKDYLNQTKEHPTADTIYTHLRESNPNLSLGTVYRNLSLLVELGEVLKLTCGDGSDRYDATTKPHYHLMCRECKNVFDIDIEPLEEVNEIANQSFGGEIDSHSILFYGRCQSCCEKRK